MIPLHEVQSNAAELIQAHSYFAEESVIEDTGLEEKEIEQALRDRGFVVVVPPILSASLSDQGKGMAIVRADLMVSVIVNPKVNDAAGKANKDIAEAIEAVAAAVLEYTCTTKLPQARFKLKADAITINTFDAGAFAYDVFFERLCAI